MELTDSQADAQLVVIRRMIIPPKSVKLVLCETKSKADNFKFQVLRTKSVTKKEVNKCMAEMYDPGGIRTRAARLISKYHNH